jgi:tripartite-type tricarboxylate transporter receptor subunit TctC
MQNFFRARRTWMVGLVAGAALAGSGAAWAQAYPNKPIKFIITHAAGGLPDTVARIYAQRLSERLGQPVTVDNKPGATGMVAAQAMALAPKDGYTFMVTDGSTFSINPLISKSLSYDYKRDFVAVSLAARAPLYLAVHPKTPANNLRELIALAKAKPGTLTYGSSGIGSTHHLTMEALKAALSLDVRHVPFKGSGQSTPALVGGQVDFSVAALPSMLGFAKAGQVKVLASNASLRSPQAPDIPTVAETVPGFDFAVVIGVMAAAGTPQAAMARISQEIAEVVKHPEVIKNFQTAVIDPVGGNAQVYGQAIARENEAMARAATVADLKAE